MYLSKNIRYLRKRNNLSQDDLANKLGYKSYTTIQKWESGVSEPPFKALRSMAELFDCDVDDMANVNLELKSRQDGTTAYYFDQKTAETAQSIFENKELRILFDAARNASPEDIKTAADVLLALKRKEEYNGND